MTAEEDALEWDLRAAFDRATATVQERFSDATIPSPGWLTSRPLRSSRVELKDPDRRPINGFDDSAAPHVGDHLARCTSRD